MGKVNEMLSALPVEERAAILLNLMDDSEVRTTAKELIHKQARTILEDIDGKSVELRYGTSVMVDGMVVEAQRVFSDEDGIVRVEFGLDGMGEEIYRLSDIDTLSHQRFILISLIQDIEKDNG